MLGADDLLGDSGGRLVDIVQRSAAAARCHVVNSVLQIVLIVVVVAEEPCRQVFFLEQRNQRGHLRIITLAPRDRRYRRMVRYHEAEIRLLALSEVFFEPPYLLVP